MHVWMVDCVLNWTKKTFKKYAKLNLVYEIHNACVSIKDRIRLTYAASLSLRKQNLIKDLFWCES